MSKARIRVTESLVDWVVPFLKKQGFQGAFPTFRREANNHLQLVTFQFSGFDQAFCVTVAKCPLAGISFQNDIQIAPRKVTALHCPQRLYLGVQDNNSSHWFKYNPRPHELQLQAQFSFLTMYKDTLLKYKRIADDIIRLLDSQAEEYWQTAEAWWESEELPVYNYLFHEFQAGLEKQRKMADKPKMQRPVECRNYKGLYLEK